MGMKWFAIGLLLVCLDILFLRCVCDDFLISLGFVIVACGMCDWIWNRVYGETYR